MLNPLLKFEVQTMKYEVKHIVLHTSNFVLVYTLLFLGGRQPLCGKGVTSLIMVISMPD